uniref:Uncharacterized protein n=1 Tax=Rhizophora mucronata TaxID=61149 RepID=A0A2P2J033_RHIMU
MHEGISLTIIHLTSLHRSQNINEINLFLANLPHFILF